jgi:hypothetical protein
MRGKFMLVLFIVLFAIPMATAFAQDTDRFAPIWAATEESPYIVEIVGVIMVDPQPSVQLLLDFIAAYGTENSQQSGRWADFVALCGVHPTIRATVWVDGNQLFGECDGETLSIAIRTETQATATMAAGTLQPTNTAVTTITTTLAGNAGANGVVVTLTPNWTYNVLITGTVTYGPLAGSGSPEGLSNISRSYNIIRAMTHGAVLWSVQSGMYLCGAECTITTDTTGQVRFFLNDNMPENNSGSFAILLTPIAAAATSTPIVSAPVATATATATAIPGTITFSLNANAGERGYSVSGLTVGTTYSVTFTGTVELNRDSSWRSTPNGRSDTANQARYNLDPSITHGAVMIVTADGYALCGAECTFIAGATGSVTFVVNDRVFDNNEGSFSGVIVPAN